jgi:hypothetical protein
MVGSTKPARHLVPKLLLGNAKHLMKLKLQPFEAKPKPADAISLKAGALNTSAFPSWSLGTR